MDGLLQMGNSEQYTDDRKCISRDEHSGDDDLPPGIYQLRAQKKDPTSGAMLESETKTVSLDGANSSCELQVP